MLRAAAQTQCFVLAVATEVSAVGTCQAEKCPSFVNTQSQAAAAGFLNFAGFPQREKTTMNALFFPLVSLSVP